MSSSLVRALSASVLIPCALVACAINASMPRAGTTNASASGLASPDHTVHFIELGGSVPPYSCCQIAVDPVLNRVYVGAGADVFGDNTVVVNPSSSRIVHKVPGFGGADNVDPDTHNVWLPGLDAGNVAVYSGLKHSIITKVQLSDYACPVSSWLDGRRRYAWIPAECGHPTGDPVWVVDADSPYNIVAGPIITPGGMSTNVVNPVTGKFYMLKDLGGGKSGNYEIDPRTFKASSTSFGVAIGANTRADLLYAYIPYGLNIIDGRTEKIIKTVKNLPYTEGIIAVNPSLDHFYLAAGKDFIEVREGQTGKLLKTITLPSSYSVLSLGADDERARIYAVVDEGGPLYLRWWKD